MKTAVKILLLLGVIGYLIFAVTKLAHDTGEVTCEAVTIVFNDTLSSRFITENDIYGILRKHKIYAEGKPLSEINLLEIDSFLLESPYIDKVHSYYTGGGRLCIQVTPQHPILHVISQNGEDYYLDSKGVIMPVDTINANLCVATGRISRQIAQKHLIPLAQFIYDNDFWRQQIEQIHVADENHIELYPRVGNHTILLGDASNVADKLDRLFLFYRKGLPTVGWNKYKTINLTFDGQIVCTKNE